MKNNKKINVGDYLKFYDCDQAFKDKDFSGKNPKHFPIGKIIKIYNKKLHYEYIDELCDILINDHISKGHFVSSIILINNL